MPITTVPAEKAAELTQDRIIEILDSELSTELDSLFGRSTNSNGDKVASDGSLLTDPDRYKRQPVPVSEEDWSPDGVTVYVGQDAQARYDEMSVASGTGRIARVRVPYAVRVVFRVALESASDPITGDTLQAIEVANRRADRYVGAIKHTLLQYGTEGTESNTRANAISKIEPTQSLSQSQRIQLGPDSSEIITGGVFRFEILQDQLFPLVKSL